MNKRENMKSNPFKILQMRAMLSLPASGLKLVTKPYPTAGKAGKMWEALGIWGGHYYVFHPQYRDRELLL